MARHRHTVTYYSAFKQGDKVSFNCGDKALQGIVEKTGFDLVDSKIVPIYLVRSCDVNFDWGDKNKKVVYEDEIIIED